MSQQRSGLLAGLIIGFFATLLGAAGFGAAIYFSARLPLEVRQFGDGVPLGGLISLALGLVVGFALWAVRPRSLVLPFAAALYACASLLLGFLGTFVASALDTGGPMATADEFRRVVTAEASVFWSVLKTSSRFWLMLALAACPAFLLTLLRVLRLRRRTKLEEPAPDEEPAEPEYRAPFEPLNAPTPNRPTTDLFTPRTPQQ
ncbi:hypothetical protein ABZ297_37795 [Nonomuraea sp. NPDC005983]|uniref:hypothetical protein n=1 Tax=Nonomuraea sp. NPDC005983 TaxID=3155595 RepID=UPI0033AF7F3A